MFTAETGAQAARLPEQSENNASVLIKIESYKNIFSVMRRLQASRLRSSQRIMKSEENLGHLKVGEIKDKAAGLRSIISTT